MPQSGIEGAIRELEQEIRRTQEIISMLKTIRPMAGTDQRRRRAGRNLSEGGRRRISQAAKRRWAALRASRKQSGKTAKA